VVSNGLDPCFDFFLHLSLGELGIYFCLPKLLGPI
jgi:hypothetical protein